MVEKIPKNHYKLHRATSRGKADCISCGKLIPDGQLKIDLTSNIRGEISRGYHCTVCAGELGNHSTLI